MSREANRSRVRALGVTGRYAHHLLNTLAGHLASGEVCWLELCCNLLDSGPELLSCGYSWIESAGSTVTREEELVKAGGGWKGIGSCATRAFAFFFLLKKLNVFFVCVYMCGCAHATLCMWRSKDLLWELVLPIHCGTSRDRTQAIRFGHYPQSLLTIYPGPYFPSDDAVFPFSNRFYLSISFFFLISY